MANKSYIAPTEVCRADEVAGLKPHFIRPDSLTGGQPDNFQFAGLNPHHTGVSSLTDRHPLRGIVQILLDCPLPRGALDRSSDVNMGLLAHLECKAQYGRIRSEIPSQQKAGKAGLPGKTKADEEAGVTKVTGKQCESVAEIDPKVREEGACD